MRFKLIESFDLNEDVFFHKAHRDKNGNVVDDQGVPINPKITPDLAKRFSPFWDKADDDIIDPSEYSPFTDGIYPDWNREDTEGTGDGETDSDKPSNKPGEKQNSDNSTDSDGEDDTQKEAESETDENGKKREYSKNSTKETSADGGGGDLRQSNQQDGQQGKQQDGQQGKQQGKQQDGQQGKQQGAQQGDQDQQSNQQNQQQNQENQSNEDRRIFVDTLTGKRYKKINNKYVEI